MIPPENPAITITYKFGIYLGAVLKQIISTAHFNGRCVGFAAAGLSGDSDIVQHDNTIVGAVEYKPDALKPGRLE